MKALQFILFAAMMFLLFNGCQNELNLPPADPAQGSLHDSSGNCYPSVVNGIYKKDSTLNSSNFIEANVFITTPGTYEIQTDSINGFSFHGSGTIVNAGANTVHLSGSGQPLAEGMDTFHLSFGGSVCEVPVQVISNTTPPAVFTLGGNGGACTGAVLAGIYTSNVATTSANTVTLDVTVTTAGPYSISTNVVNGVSFSGSGVLATSTTSIVLTAQGTPAASATDVISGYTVTAGAGSCSFSVTYAGVPAGPASFTFDCANTDPVIASAPGIPLRVEMTFDPAVNLIHSSVNVITPGTYTITTTYGLGGADGVNLNTSGTFTTTGVQTLTLHPQGVPTRGGIVFYNISSPQATNPTPCSTAAYYYNLFCTIGTSFNRNFTFSSQTVNDNTSLAGYDLVRMKGFASTTTGESLELVIGLPTGGSFDNTTSTDVIYSANDFPAKYVKAVYTDGSAPQVLYSAETNGTVQTNPLTINISFCTGGRIEGSYSGVVKDNNGAGPGTKTISGSFGLVR